MPSKCVNFPIKCYSKWFVYINLLIQRHKSIIFILPTSYFYITAWKSIQDFTIYQGRKNKSKQKQFLLHFDLFGF